VSARGLARINAYTQALVESLAARARVSNTKARGEASPGRIAGGGGYGAREK
jgi:hypothetical protein